MQCLNANEKMVKYEMFSVSEEHEKSLELSLLIISWSQLEGRKGMQLNGEGLSSAETE